MRKADALYTGSELETDCMIDRAATEVNQPANVPPALAVVNPLVGLELVPFDPVRIHVDAGFHSVLYVGAGATFYLW